MCPVSFETVSKVDNRLLHTETFYRKACLGMGLLNTWVARMREEEIVRVASAYLKPNAISDVIFENECVQWLNI